MSNEELAVEIQSGHTELQEQLWDGVKFYVIKKANTFFNLGKEYIRCEKDDLIQAGYIAMMDATTQYNPERGCFLTFLTFYLRSAFMETAKGYSEKQQKDPLFYADDLDREILDGCTLKETIPSDEPNTEEIAVDHIGSEEIRQGLERIMDMILSESESEVINRYYFYGETLSGIAQKECVPRQNIASLHDSALRKMRRKNREILALVDNRTNFYSPVGVSTFNRTNESAVERIARQRQTLSRKLKYRTE